MELSTAAAAGAAATPTVDLPTDASTPQPPHADSCGNLYGSAAVPAAGASEPESRMGEEKIKEKRPKREGAWSGSCCEVA